MNLGIYETEPTELVDACWHRCFSLNYQWIYLPKALEWMNSNPSTIWHESTHLHRGRNNATVSLQTYNQSIESGRMFPVSIPPTYDADYYTIPSHVRSSHQGSNITLF